jgi:hypothetical protein
LFRSVRKADGTQWVFSFAVLAALVGAFAAMVWLFALAIREGSTVVAATLAALATVSAAVIVRYFERRKELEAARRQHLGPLYEQLAAALAGQAMTERKIQKVVHEFMRKSLVYASPPVLSAFRAWKDSLPDDENDWPPHVLRRNALLYEAFVKAMRKDLGVSNWMLEEGDLARTALSDFDDLPEAAPPALVPPDPDDEPRVSARHRPRARARR